MRQERADGAGAVLRPGSGGGRRPRVAVIGAGPAGLTAAYQLAKAGVPTTVFEADSVVGGISRTVVRDGWRFDIGGHRFFTKVGRVDSLWHELLEDGDFLERTRISRIHYRGATFDYPLRALNALAGLGVWEAGRCLLSYGRAQLRPPSDQSNFEGWMTARFGRRLYEIFFKTYTEKVWGMPATEIRADWAAQRIRNLSLPKAVLNALIGERRHGDVVSLIERFQYPRLGPGMMWERACERATALGATVHLGTPVTGVLHQDGAVTGVVVRQGGRERLHPADHVISSMPLRELVGALTPAPPPEVLRHAQALRYRDFLTVAVVVPESASFPDTWIYIHDPDVHVGRIQNYRSWSPDMVRPGTTCLGLEYFVNEGDALWSRPDADLVRLAIGELERLRLVAPGEASHGYVVRMPKAYPVYDRGYQVAVDGIRRWIDPMTTLHPVGRNGMHRYNNQDHSMLTAMLAVENILGARHDLWSVNVDREYHEEVRPAGREYRVTPAPQPASP
jgi:protoporphyrinogen oxidase